MRVVLVNMPFASLRFPSFALSQLAALVRSELGNEVELEVVYANHEFAELVGVDFHDELTENVEHHPTGLGDWLFRQVAFPQLQPNDDLYLRTFYAHSRHDALRARVLEARSRLAEFCARVASDHDLASADVVGFTSMFAQTVPSVAMARTLKDLDPRVLTIIGGANCEAPMGAALLRTTSALDFAFSGPALETFPLFLRRLLDGRLGDCQAVPGIVSVANAALPRWRQAVGATRPVDDLIEPDFSAFVDAFEDTYAGTGVRPGLFFETSRGCWWGERSHCTFCGLNGLSMSYAAMRPVSAVAQFESLFRHHPWCSDYSAVDNVMPATYPTDVFPRVSPPAGAKIFYEVKLDLGRQELAAMARAGVTLVQPGIEALATGTLKLMRKGTTSFQNLRFLMECLALGITPLWNLLIGFPGEDESVYEKYSRDLPLLRHLPPPVGVFSVRFDRYSPYFTDADAYGLALEPFPFYGLTYPGEEELSELAYYFVDVRDAAYRRAARRWWPALRRLVEDWRSRWSDAHGRPVLQLRSRRGAPEIVDSRTGTTDTYALDERALLLLRRLQTPARIDQVSAHLGERADGGEEALEHLRERGLLFEDGQKMLSLVEMPVVDPGGAARRGLRRESRSKKLART